MATILRHIERYIRTYTADTHIITTYAIDVIDYIDVLRRYIAAVCWF